jgi:hypothetical protein
VIERVLININASPNAGVICADGDDAQRRLHAFKVLLPEIISWRLTDDNGFAGLLAITLVALDPVGPIGDV